MADWDVSVYGYFIAEYPDEPTEVFWDDSEPTLILRQKRNPSVIHSDEAHASHVDARRRFKARREVESPDKERAPPKGLSGIVELSLLEVLHRINLLLLERDLPSLGKEHLQRL